MAGKLRIQITSLMKAQFVAAAVVFLSSASGDCGPVQASENKARANPSGTVTAGSGNQRDIAIHGSAKKHENKLSSADVPGTDGGNFACAWAVNFVVKDGIGREVGGDLSTAVMFEELVAGRGKEVDLSIAPPGSVVISPTEFRPDGSRNTGHVGILGAGMGDQRPIYSNSSKHARWESYFTVGTWTAYYKVKKGLKVRTYSVNP